MNLDRLCDEAAAAGSGNPTSAITFNTATHSQTPKPDLQSLHGMSQDKMLPQRRSAGAAGERPFKF